VTLKEIRVFIEGIRRIASDDEGAHVQQDILYESFIEYVASLNISISRKAKEVLKVRKIEFSRWYA